MKSFETAVLLVVSVASSVDGFAPSGLSSFDRKGIRKISKLNVATLTTTLGIQDENSTSFDPVLEPSLEALELLSNFLKKDDAHASSSSPATEDDALRDIIKDLDGNPLTTEYLAQKMGVENADSFMCPEQDAFRGFMSDACRIRLLPGGETAFYKRIVFEDLNHAWEKLKTAPFKLARDTKSYGVVASFLSSKACQEVMKQTGVCIPKCYDVQQRPNHDNPIESKYSFLLEDFAPSAGWYQHWLLCDIAECEAALSTFAKIHAFFWHGSSFWTNQQEAAKELEEGIWKSGSYVQPEAQNTENLNQCKIVAEEWAKKRLRFEKELSPFEFWDNLGERLESVAEECGRLAHPFANDALSESYKEYRTFTHGDPKQANLFFKRSDISTEQVSEDLQVGLIDFQWSGFGLAATDIAHFMTSAVHADMLNDGGEDRLLQYYYNELQRNLVEYGVFDTKEEAVQKFSHDKFIDQYELGVLDICRLMIAYTWSRFEEPVEKGDEAACVRTMNKTSYNKSIPTIVWLLSRCDEIMKSRGV